MRTFAIFFLLLVAVSFTGCNKDSDNPTQTTTSQYKGTWEISAYVFSGGITDSLLVNLSMDGNNGALTGTGKITHGTNKSGSTVVTVINGNILGSYTDSNISLYVIDKTTSNKFTYSGTQQSSTSGLSYTGNAAIITSIDTTNFANLTFIKGPLTGEVKIITFRY